MNYAIQVLENERKQLDKILREWPEGLHPEAKKDRQEKYRELTTAILFIS